MSLAVSWNDVLPCPEARNWTPQQWAAHYGKKPVVRPNLVVLPKLAIVAPAPEPVLVEPPKKRESRRCYGRPIGPKFSTRRVIECELTGYKPQRTITRIEDLTSDNVTLDDIVPYALIEDWVMRKHDASRVKLFASSRLFSKARFELWGLSRRHTHLSSLAMGRISGDRDHTSILYGIAEYEQWVARGRIVPWGREFVAPAGYQVNEYRPSIVISDMDLAQPISEAMPCP